MTRRQAVKEFVTYNKPFNEYWEMQFSWSNFTDLMSRMGRITERQRCNWDNPCTPETFKQFNKKFKGLDY